MSHETATRKRYENLRRRPGPKGWQGKAAAALGYSRGYISRVASGKVDSPAARAALAEWRSKNAV